MSLNESGQAILNQLGPFSFSTVHGLLSQGSQKEAVQQTPRAWDDMVLWTSKFIPHQCLSDQIGWVLQIKSWFIYLYFIYFLPAISCTPANTQVPDIMLRTRSIQLCALILIASPVIDGLHAELSWQVLKQGTYEGHLANSQVASEASPALKTATTIIRECPGLS